MKLTNQIRSRSLRLPGFPLTRRATSARKRDHRWFPTETSPLRIRGSPTSAESGPLARISHFDTTTTTTTAVVYHETQISFCIRRSVCTDCSDRSHPSHIGFVAGNRIHVHLCCYYRAIGVFVYWLTKSTDIESDNRHYFCPVPDPFSNPLPPPPSPLSRSRPRNAAHGTDRSAKYRGGARETRA